MNPRSNIKPLAFLVILLPAFIQAQMPRITVQGNEFVDENGKVFVFRGYSSSDPEKLVNQGSWNLAYFQEMQRWGANVVRFPIHPKAWRARGKENYLELLDQGVEWAAATNMYVIMDWHSIGNLVTEKYLRDIYETNLEETFEFWRIISERYGDNATVALYELFNEPVRDPKFGQLKWQRWKEILEELITEIRANGGKGIPLVAGFNWAYNLKPVENQPIEAEGIAYVSHPYPQKRKQPWPEKWTKDWGFAKEKYPVILTEIGYCREEDPGAHIPVISDHSYGEAISSYSDQNNISYIVWVFDKNWSPQLFTDDQFTPSYQGTFWKEKLNGY
ncbi:MAG: cellulase family glycosylhydrolase [Cytophagales bacterium]|nr:cellulase family glycosylhydrolase [Cytophagales bacterium]